jgi:two-component system, chemotaxis family, sensor kinase CheA
MDDVVREFLLESREGTGQMEVDLVQLERDPANGEIVGRLFRVIHTIKGTCGFFGFIKLQKVTHAAESLLSRVREGELGVTPEIVSALLETLDVVRRLLANIESSETEGDLDPAPQVARLVRLNEGQPAAEGPPPGPAPAPVTPVGSSAAGPVKPVMPVLAAAEITAVSDVAAAAVESHVRVDVALLDGVMALVGELVLLRNEVLQAAAGADDPGLTATSQKLDLITTQLQVGVLKTRMQPLGSVWNKFPRVVRDLAASLGKQIRLVMTGEETELDRTLIEAIRDPLTHMVRNSIDHGIEGPDARATAGKAREGVLELRARHQGGQVVIEIADDGAGIDVEKVKAKALARGLITGEQARHLGEKEALELIFLPGLSTAESVTAVSGRGVGLDIVRSNIRRINGSIDIETHPGRGTTFRIKLPLTLAIIPALLVTCEGQRFVIPQTSLLELVRFEGTRAATTIERYLEAPVFRLRERLRPIVYLGRELGLTAVDDRRPRPTLTIVVLQVDDQPFGLVVDRIDDAHEIVVKSLGKQLRGLSLFGGATILGDGTVALIIDVEGLAKHAQVIKPDEGRREARSVQTSGPGPAPATRSAILCRCGGDSRVAVPMERVTRLDQLPGTAIERVGLREVAQTRGKILPLIRIADLLDERRRRPRSAVPPRVPGDTEVVRIIVHTAGTEEVGLVVDEIVDIVEVGLAPANPGGRPFVQGSEVVQGRVTEILDVEAMIRGADLGMKHRRSQARSRALG